MDQQRKHSPRDVGAQVESVRRIYSRIGEPLPAEILIDLYRHLGKVPISAMENAPHGGRKKQIQDVAERKPAQRRH